MIIELVRGMSDVKRWFRNSDFAVRNWYGKTVGMAKASPADQRTPSQLAARGSMKEAGLAWRDLPEETRAQWNDYARRFGNVISAQLYNDVTGWGVFLPAWRNRALLVETPPVAPLDHAPPTPVVAVEEVFTGVETTCSFRVTHGVGPEGHVLLVRMTPETATRARQPYARTARMIRGHGPESMVPLPASGGVVTFTNACFAIRPGRRYGIAMRIVRVEDGVHSREFFADLYRDGADGGIPPEGASDTTTESADVPGEDTPGTVVTAQAAVYRNATRATGSEQLIVVIVNSESRCSTTGRQSARGMPRCSRRYGLPDATYDHRTYVRRIP